MKLLTVAAVLAAATATQVRVGAARCGRAAAAYLVRSAQRRSLKGLILRAPPGLWGLRRRLPTRLAWPLTRRLPHAGPGAQPGAHLRPPRPCAAACAHACRACCFTRVRRAAHPFSRTRASGGTSLLPSRARSAAMRDAGAEQNTRPPPGRSARSTGPPFLVRRRAGQSVDRLGASRHRHAEQRRPDQGVGAVAAGACFAAA